jgi:hypothetical protein
MTIHDFATYADYCKARAAEGLQVLPGALFRAIKEGNPNLAAPAPFNPART